MPDSQRSAFFDEDLQVFVQCNNASDALLAPLVFKFKNGVDIDLINIFLEIMQNPSFDSKEVTFKNTGDILAHVAETRERDISSLVDAKASSPKNPKQSPGRQIPLIIVEFAIGALRDEMMHIAAGSFTRGGGNWMEIQEKRTLREHWQNQILVTLLKCSLVHSSWLLRARHAAGAFLQKYKNPVIQFIRNPCFGQWTREIHMKFNLSLPCSVHLAALFERAPNVKFLSLDISRRISLSLTKSVAHMFSKNVSKYLRYLREFSISFDLPDPLDQCSIDIASNFLTFPHAIPSLNTIRVAGIKIAMTPDPPFVVELSGVAPNLRQIHAQTSLASGDHRLKQKPGPISVSWARDTDSGQMDFLPNHLHYWIFTKFDGPKLPEPSGGERMFLSAVRSLRFDHHVQPFDHHVQVQRMVKPQNSQNINAFLHACSSIVSFELSVPWAHTSNCSFTLKNFSLLPRTVEELHIHIHYNFSARSKLREHESQFDHMDRRLSGALISLNLEDFRLRAVNVHGDLIVHWHEPNFVEAFASRRTAAWCSHNSISFVKTMKSELYSVHYIDL